jgi:hypothetical protein
VCCGWGVEAVPVLGVGELGVSGGGGTKESHFGPLSPMILYFLTSTTQYMNIFGIVNIIQDIEDIIEFTHNIAHTTHIVV